MRNLLRTVQLKLCGPYKFTHQKIIDFLIILLFISPVTTDSKDETDIYKSVTRQHSSIPKNHQSKR
uniref:Uncharacterized protein n=1 Tax=Rhizoctonia solani TaxID=456999 RepID=N0A330_9AGAM|nr:hypothetical protein RSOL_m00020 [Rhizoctonia solani]AGK45345.1 hypothetical protein RSOL_m00020 [Rhizoctonia solani]